MSGSIVWAARFASRANTRPRAREQREAVEEAGVRRRIEAEVGGLLLAGDDEDRLRRPGAAICLQPAALDVRR
jgi:hypothetical protein